MNFPSLNHENNSTHEQQELERFRLSIIMPAFNHVHNYSFVTDPQMVREMNAEPAPAPVVEEQPVQPVLRIVSNVVAGPQTPEQIARERVDAARAEETGSTYPESYITNVAA